MSEKKVDTDQLSKALDALKDIAKGGNTISYEVPGMTGVSGSPQIFHTASNSEQRTWAGTTQTDVPGNGTAQVSVTENGTDYAGSVVKSVLTLLKAGKISEEAAQILLEKALPFEKKDKDKDDDKDDDKDVKKSASDKEDEDDVAKSVAASAVIKEGFEVSSFLQAFGETIVKALSAQSAEIKALNAKIEGVGSKSGEFQKSLAGAVSTLAEVVVGTSQRTEQLAAQPARGAKSVAVLEKSFGGQHSEKENFSKSQLLDSAVDLVKKGQLQAHTVLKLESDGTVSPADLRLITANVSGQ